jgi:hypothetical protein
MALAAARSDSPAANTPGRPTTYALTVPFDSCSNTTGKWRVIVSSLLPRLDAGVLQDPIQESGADILLRVDSDGDNPFGQWIPELPMAAFAGPEFLEAVGLQ